MIKFLIQKLTSQEQLSYQRQQRMDMTKLNAQDIFSLIQQRKLSWHAVQTVFNYLKLLLNKLDGNEYIYWLKYLAKLISLGYGGLVVNEIQLQKRLLEMFNLSFKNFLIEPDNKGFSYTIFQVSVIADLFRAFPQSIYPYNAEFIEHTIKLSQFIGRNKESEEKLGMIISILYFSFTQNPEIYRNEVFFDTFKHHIISQIKKAQKDYKYQQYELLCQTFENLIQKSSLKITNSKDYPNHSKTYQFLGKQQKLGNKSFHMKNIPQYTKEK